MKERRTNPAEFRLAFLCGWVFLWGMAAVPSATAQDSLDRDYSAELPRIPPTEPSDASATFEIDPRLRIDLLAAEPDVEDPVAIAFDEWARAYVVEMRGYSEQADERISRIRLLEDHDGDGRFDRSTIFAEDLRWPTAVACLRGGILVADAPDILYLRDADGDRRADVREVVFSGFGTQNVQQLLNSFHWSLDLRIHGSSGGNGGLVQRADSEAFDLCGLNASADPHPKVDLNGRDFAIDPRRIELRATSGGGQFGLTFDRWGNRYVCANSDHCQQVVIEDRYIARNSSLRIASPRMSIAVEGPAAEVFRISPVEPWRLVRTRLRVQGLVPGPVEGGGRAAGYFTSAAGITYYDGDALPDEYAHCLFIGDVGSNLVHRKRLIDEGIVKSAKRVELKTEFLRSRDNWFRPVQFAVGPDGSLIVLDMYRETVEHPASLPPLIRRHLDLASGNDRGRIYRVVPKDFVPPKRQLLGDASTEHLVATLGHANGWHRATAARLLLENWSAEAAHVLRKQGLTSKNPEARIRAMYLLAEFGELPRKDLLRSLDDEAPYVRVHAARVSERFPGDIAVTEHLCRLAADADPRVRFQAALSIGERLDADVTPKIASALARLANQDGDSEWFRAAIASSAMRCRGVLLKQLLTGRSSETHSSGAESVARELIRQVARDGDDSELSVVADALQAASVSAAEPMGIWLLPLATAPESQLVRIQKAFGGESAFRNTLDRTVEWASRIAQDPRQSIQARIESIEVLRLARPEHFGKMLPEFLSLQSPPAIRSTALATAGHFAASEIGAAILDELETMSPQLRTQACQVLLGRGDWTSELLDRLSDGRVRPVLLDAGSRQQLSQHVSPEIRQRAANVFGAAPNTDRAAVVDEYATRLESLIGDATRGRATFVKHCAVCHRLENEGFDVGPTLVASAQRGPESLLQQILDPNREVDARYLAFVVQLVDGRTARGVITSETATSLTVRTADGQTLTIGRDEIEAMRSSTLSLMPENFENDITVQEMVDLIAYLLSQRG